MSPAGAPTPNAFIRQLPKAELHLHLEGAVEPATLLELRKHHGESATLAETEALYRYSDFPSFLMAFKEVSAHLRGPDDYELATYRLMQRLKEENVLHAEVYVAVGVCLYRKQDFGAIFEGLERGRARGARDFGVSLLWIFDATRHFGVEEAQKVFELAVRYQDRHVVGIGIGGDEVKAPPELFRGVYTYAADHGLHLTAHAGETGPAESIWGALNLHAEVYVAVGVCLYRKQDFGAIFEGLERGRARGARDFGVSLLWIFDATRHFGVEEAQRVFELAVRYRDRHVVGVGIGGDEIKAPPELFRGVYAYAGDHGLHLTAHAGETGTAESIWGALNLHAERIGHGFSASQDPDLVEELAYRQIPVEICITSNVRTGVCKSAAEHPVKSYFDQGIMVTLNTDDPALFGTSLAREYQLAQQTFGFTDEHLRELARNSFEASFLPAEKKLELLSLFDAAVAG